MIRTRRMWPPGNALPVTLVALLLAPLLTLLGPGRPVAAQTARPNVVLILLDDMRADDLALMSKTQALLVAQGTSFSRAFVTLPLCCPSRASILRGQHVHNHNVKYISATAPGGGFPGFRTQGLERSTVATWLNTVGYRTALIGKYLNFYPQGVSPRYVPPGWDQWMGWIKGHYFDYQQNVNGTVVRRGTRPIDYATDVEARYASDWVKAVARTGEPFFLHLSPRTPHGPLTPAPRHRRSPIRQGRVPRTAAFNEADISDKPGWVRRWPLMNAQRIGQLDQSHRLRQRMLLAADEMVASLVATLQQAGELDNTYILFTSDNGYGLGEHRIEGKHTAYEESIRVPLVVRGPGIPVGRVEDRLALNIDLAPTIAELVGIAPPDFVDGRSLLPLLRNDDGVAWRDAALIEYYRPGSNLPDEIDPAGIKASGVAGAPPGWPYGPTYRGLRTVDRLYVEYANGERELYDLANDPLELNNLAKNPTPEWRAEMDRLQAWLRDLRACRAESCRTAEVQPMSPPPPAGGDPSADQPSADPPASGQRGGALRAFR